jgi:hypothetical protein
MDIVAGLQWGLTPPRFSLLAGQEAIPPFFYSLIHGVNNPLPRHDATALVMSVKTKNPKMIAPLIAQSVLQPKLQ